MARITDKKAGKVKDKHRAPLNREGDKTKRRVLCCTNANVKGQNERILVWAVNNKKVNSALQFISAMPIIPFRMALILILLFMFWGGYAL
jgi:hypothetical protein